MPITLNGSTGITSPGGDTSTSLSTGTLTVSGATSNINAVNTFGFKNRIINGGMTIDQRNAGASVNITGGAGVYSLDRWVGYGTQNSKFTIQQNAGSVTPPVGYINYLGATSSSAYTVGAGETFVIQQFIEGLNVADLAWGTANAKTVTLSFQVYSSLTGTFGGSILNSAQNRSYPFSYTVSSANTWTSISVTIAGDTSGTWLTTNGIGMRVTFSMGTGSTGSGTAGSWSGNQYFSATGATSVVGTNGATFYITGVQLEVGSQATSFDFRDYGRELILCQRYYQTGNGFASGWAGGSTTMGGSGQLYPTMRANPSTVTVVASSGGNYSGQPSFSTSGPTFVAVIWGTNGVNTNAYGTFAFTASAEL